MTELGHCQCPSDPGSECMRTPTGEDLLCDLCRMTKAVPNKVCFTVRYNGGHVVGMRHGQTDRILDQHSIGIFHV